MVSITTVATWHTTGVYLTHHWCVICFLLNPLEIYACGGRCSRGESAITAIPGFLPLWKTSTHPWNLCLWQGLTCSTHECAILLKMALTILIRKLNNKYWVMRIKISSQWFSKRIIKFIKSGCDLKVAELKKFCFGIRAVNVYCYFYIRVNILLGILNQNVIWVFTCTLVSLQFVLWPNTGLRFWSE